MASIQTIESKKRPIQKHNVLGLIALWLLYKLITDFNTFLALIFAILVFFIFVEIVTFKCTELTIENNKLIVIQKNYFYSITKKQIIDFNDIHFAYYELEKHDSYTLIFRPLQELLFPSGNSFIQITTLDRKTQRIPFKGDSKKVKQFISQLPDRTPN